MALRVEERIVAGGGEDVVVVHHLVLRGSNRAIGRHLGQVAQARYHVSLRPSADPLRARIEREWLRRHAPVHLERMRGVADAFGVDAEDDRLELARLGAPPPSGMCSAVVIPPGATEGGSPLVSRTLDLPAPAAVRAGEPAAPSRPYVLETHPDEGHAALALVACDLLGAALDGVNAEGLCVVASCDLEAGDGGARPPGCAAGLEGLQLGRVLLDGCATAAEARQVLRAAHDQGLSASVHWIIADRHGDAFAFEAGPGQGIVHVVEAAGTALVRTNHGLHRYPGDAGLPRGDGPGRTYARYRALRAALAEGPRAWTPEALANAAGRVVLGPGAGPERTLWHAIYDLGARTLEASFFLKDEPDPLRRGAVRAVRTPPLRFSLGA